LLFTRLFEATAASQIATQCAVCRGWDDQRVCASCTGRFIVAGPRCVRCALRVPAGVSECGACLKRPPLFDSAVAALDYGHPWDRLIARFKFNAALDLTRTFVRLMETASAACGGPRKGLLLPVPLSDKRLRERGYNQSWELARRLRRPADCRADPHLLLRIRESPHQLSLPLDDRAANVKDVFAIEPRRRHEVKGRTVTLVDDVMTTGATVSEAARVLRDAGAAEVHVLVLARTPSPGE
jgi:ComF family protein